MPVDLPTATVPVFDPPGGHVASAAFDGSATHLASATSEPLTVNKLATNLTLSSTLALAAVGGESGITATLRTSAGVPVADHTVFFRLVPAPSSGPPVVVARVTGVTGTAQLGIVTLPDGRPLGPGSYTVQAIFGPHPALGFVAPDDPIFNASTSTAVPVTFARRILFASTRTGNGDIYAVPPAGGTAARLTSDPAIDAEPEWSPNGDKVLFSSTRNGNVEIYVMNANGTGVTRLTNNSAIDTSPSWSPNGQKIAFASNRGGNWDIYTMNTDGLGAQRLTTHQSQDLLPTWSPNSTQIAFMSLRTGNGDIYTMNAANGSSQTKRTTDSGIDTEPAWSGNRIAFSTNRHGTLNFEIYTMPEGGGTQTRITSHAGVDITPAWLSNGSIAFATNRPPGGGVNLNIFTMGPTGNAPTPVVTHQAADVFPDG